jgi:hypothetical protein
VKADLENGSQWPLGNRKFGSVIVTNYLHRPLFRSLISAVANDGVLIYETFGVGNDIYAKPSCPKHLIKPGELIDVVKGKLQIVAYEHGYTDIPRPSIRQRICAVRSIEPTPLPSY